MVQLLNGDTLQLGNVESSRDFTFVRDTARGMIMASIEKNAVGETINIGSGGDIKIKDLAYLIAELLGKREMVSIKLDESRLRPYDVNRLFCDPSKAKRILGWAPTVPIKDGLKTTLDWVKSNPIEYRGPYREQPKVLKK
jgi:dTDP-glucose 4,6-dehydratase